MNVEVVKKFDLVSGCLVYFTKPGAEPKAGRTRGTTTNDRQEVK